MGHNSEILIRRKNLIVIPVAEGRTNSGVIAAFNLNLQELGYVLSRQAINILKATSYATVVKVAQEVLDFAQKAKGQGAGLAHPMYPNFPSQVAEASDAELYLNAILHYWSVAIADLTATEEFVWLPRYRKNPRGVLSKTEKVKLTVLHVVGDGKTAPIYKEIQKQLVTSNTSMSAQDKQDIRELVKSGYVLPHLTEIPNKENLAVYVAELIREGDPVNETWFQHGTDVLRLATALSDGDVSLKDNTKFVSFKRPVRRMLLDLLAKDKNIQEAMARDPERFIRLGERLHPAETRENRYHDLRNAFRILRGNVRLETFSGYVEKLIKDGQPSAASQLLSTRPGELARRLDQLLVISAKKRSAFQAEKVVTDFSRVASKVSTPVLLQLATHFENRNHESLRVIMPKGEVSKIQVLEKTRPSLDPGWNRAIVDVANEALMTKFSRLPKLGKVYVDPELNNYLIPFNQRSASAGLRTITRGSKLPFGTEKDTLRFFIHWKNYDATKIKTSYGYYETSSGRTDLDLSAVMYGPNWEDKGRVWYGNLRDYHLYGERDGYKAVHSGDITDAPNGAAEFIDIHIPSAIAYGARYLVATVNMFAGPENFSQVPECFGGWMLREKPKSGEVFEPKTVVDKIDITSPSRMVVPFIFDLVERKMIWVDSEVSGVQRWGSNIRNQQEKIVLVGKAFTQVAKPTLGDLFSLHGTARGRLVSDPNKADTVFSTKNGIQFDLAKIASEYLVE